jgi:3-deoxy-D-manno-octulosonic-acid transferase
MRLRKVDKGDIFAKTVLGLYRLAGHALAPLAGTVVRLRAHKGKEDNARRKERFGHASKDRPIGSLVWIHAASVGETLAVLPLIKRIEASGVRIVLTTGTVTSARLAAKTIGPDTIHQYVPLDCMPFVNRFLDHWTPDLALFVESELWPGFIHALKQRSIPHVLVNARMSERSFYRWKKVPALIHDILGHTTLCLAQTMEDGERYRALGAPRVVTTGNLKFDSDPPSAEPEALASLIHQIQGRPVWLAASTHEGEEAMIAKVHRSLAKHIDNLLTIIAPRHPQRGEAIADEVASLGLKPSLRSQSGKIQPDTQVYIADTIGEMGLLYRIAPICFLGGSLVEHGGQNPIEPTRLECAIVHGPHIQNFSEIYAALNENDGAIQVETLEALAKTVGIMLLKPKYAATTALAARDALEHFGGALERTLDALAPHLHLLSVSAELEGTRLEGTYS